MQLGDYVAIKPLGKGALGEAMIAEHRFLKRPYVLKVLSDELSSDPDFVSRFEKEVTSLSMLEHPNIVKMHTVSEADGKYFLVTDCVVDDQGESVNLAQYLAEKGPLSEEEVIHIASQVASALDFAHEKAIPLTHQGLKLNNIMIGKNKAVYLADFGLNRVAGISQALARTYRMVCDAMGEESLSDVHQSFLQNLAFLAPEKKYRTGEVDEVKADVYAFGVLIYYLLTHRFPEGIFEMPSQHKLVWDNIVQRCLQNDPAKRPSLLKPLLAGSDALHPLLHPAEIQRPEYDADPGAIFQTEPVVVRYEPKAEEPKDVAPLQSEMVVIRGGPFQRGSNQGNRDELPRHTVQLTSFAIDTHPVVNEQFVLFLEAMGGEKDHNNNDIIRLRESRIKRATGRLTIESGYARHPVVGVTWYGAVAYAKWVGKRLPTEAEWEVAACGGLEECTYPTGREIERSQANFFSSDTTPVMSYLPNGYGLYDMAGNVYEWCQDWYDYHYYDVSVQEPNNPKGPQQGVYRVVRGGCWKSLKEDLRCSHRHRNNPGAANGTYGFRCAADVSPA